MAQESYLLSAESIRKAWCEKHGEQETSKIRKGLAKASGLSLRENYDILNEKALVTRATLERVADAVDKAPEEIVAHRTRRWQWIPPNLGHPCLVGTLSRAVRLDMEGKHDRAIKLCTKVLEKLDFHSDPEIFASVYLKLVTFLDHDGQHERVLRLIRDFYAKAETNGVNGRDIAWARYHEGIALRRLERYDEAGAIFAELRHSDGHDFGISSLHQLGVIELEQAKRARSKTARSKLLARARRLFEQSLREWHKLCGTHREGFTLMQLGQTLALEGKYRKALLTYHEALVVFATHNCKRYVEMTRRDIVEYVLDRVLPAGR